MNINRRGFLQLLAIIPGLTVFPVIAKVTQEPINSLENSKRIKESVGALENVNIRRLINKISEDIRVILENYLFEPNDTLTRASIGNELSNYLEQLRIRKAIYDYMIVCDQSNNYSMRIEKNELHVDLAIKPSTSIEFIYLPIVISNKDVNSANMEKPI